MASHQHLAHHFNNTSFGDGGGGLNSLLSSTSARSNLMNILLSNNESNFADHMYNNNQDAIFQNNQLVNTTKISGPSSPTNPTFEQSFESNHAMMIDDCAQQLPSSLHIPNTLRRTTSFPNKPSNHPIVSNNYTKTSPTTPNNNCSTSPSFSTCNSIISNITLSHSNSMEAVADLDKALDRVSPETPCFLQLDINGFLFEWNQSTTTTTTTDNNSQILSNPHSLGGGVSAATTRLSTSSSPPSLSFLQSSPHAASTTTLVNTLSNQGQMMQQSNNQITNMMMVAERNLPKLTPLQRRNSFIVNNSVRGGSSLLSAVVKNQSNLSPASPTTTTNAMSSSPTPSLATLARKSNSSSSLNNLRGISKQRKTGTLVTETVTTTSSSIQHCVEFPKDFTFVNNSQQSISSSSSSNNSRNQSWTFYKEEAFENEKSKNSKNNFKFHNISFVHVPEK